MPNTPGIAGANAVRGKVVPVDSGISQQLADIRMLLIALVNHDRRDGDEIPHNAPPGLSMYFAKPGEFHGNT